VAPSQLVSVIGLAGNPTKRTGKDAATRKIQMDVQTPIHLIEGATLDHPWRQQPEGCPEQFVLVHGGASPGAPAIITQSN
jgi:hypothetical protein